MSRFRPGRFFGVTAGALAIIGLGLYGPATLLGPLPRVTATFVTPSDEPDAAALPALPVAGGSAVVAVDVEPDSGELLTSPLATAGAGEALPMASAAKLITALVIVEAKPIEVGTPGPEIPITAVDYRDYIDYSNADARTVAVFPGEMWSEREALQALLLGSSNNHADLLARWAFGSMDAYLAAANDWLAANGMDNTRVADATGLQDASAGTAGDLARLAAIAGTDPVIEELLANPASALNNRRGVENTTEYLPEEGIRGISRSYTDAAGVCFLFTATLGTAESPFTIAGAFLQEPDYDTLSADVTALIASARAGITDKPVLEKGDEYVTFAAPWGDTASGSVRVSKTRVSWHALTSGEPTVTVDDFATGRAGATIGRVSVDASGGPVSSPLVLDEPINDPGPGWRLLNPVPVITALIESR
ncbi:MAG TPA: hypothetical protein VEX88_00265 [Glaciibacter sp.]|nr:hypothetical protein [Glaciibacter sp.]